MGSLPTDRTTIGNKPLTNVGVDFFGLILMKLAKETRSNTV